MIETKLMINLNGKDHEITEAKARELLRELKGLFGDDYYTPYVPYIPYQPSSVQPYTYPYTDGIWYNNTVT